jgi:hypothetical protein
MDEQPAFEQLASNRIVEHASKVAEMNFCGKYSSLASLRNQDVEVFFEKCPLGGAFFPAQKEKISSAARQPSQTRKAILEPEARRYLTHYDRVEIFMRDANSGIYHVPA